MSSIPKEICQRPLFMNPVSSAAVDNFRRGYDPPARMSRRRRSRPKVVPATTPGRARRPRRGVLVGVVAVAVVLGLWAWKSRDTKPPSASPSSGEPQPSNAPAAATEARPDFRPLKGRWLRPDGGYVVEVRDVDEAGRMEAAYFNPRPIHVGRAEAKLEGGALKVLIELQDVNYPGSTYTLDYDSRSDRLVGNYYQAVERENFDVEFIRQR